MATQTTRLNGRDESGFLQGSEQQRDAARAASSQSFPRSAREETESDTVTLKRRLICPSSNPSKHRRLLARKAAFELDEDVPDWAQLNIQPPQSDKARRCER